MPSIFLANTHGWKGITIANTIQKILVESNGKPKKIWVDKGSQCYNQSMKSWLKDNDIKHMMKKNLLLVKDLLEP